MVRKYSRKSPKRSKRSKRSPKRSKRSKKRSTKRSKRSKKTKSGKRRMSISKRDGIIMKDMKKWIRRDKSANMKYWIDPITHTKKPITNKLRRQFAEAKKEVSRSKRSKK